MFVGMVFQARKMKTIQLFFKKLNRKFETLSIETREGQNLISNSGTDQDFVNKETTKFRYHLQII